MQLSLLDFVSLGLALKLHDGPTALSDDRRKLTFLQDENGQRQAYVIFFLSFRLAQLRVRACVRKACGCVSVCNLNESDRK